MTDEPLQPLDAKGRTISVGDRVKILTIPDWLVHDLPAEDQNRLRTFQGVVVKVSEIDKFGYLWFADPASGFCLRPEEVRHE